MKLAVIVTASFLASGCSGIVLDTVGPYNFNKVHGNDRREASITSLVLKPEDIDKLDEQRVLVILPRARLGNRLFQVAALLSIAKGMHAYAVIPENRYMPANTPQMAKLQSLFYSKDEVAKLSDKGLPASLCHAWDKSPMTVNGNLTRLGEWTLVGRPKGTLHQASRYGERNSENKAADWADGIKSARFNGKKCHVTELDGFFQKNEFFNNNMGMIRDMFWHQETAAKAKAQLRRIMPKGNNSIVSVSIHLRLGDYVATNRNLDLDYYRTALRMIKKDLRASKVRIACLIFSDDVKTAMKMATEFKQCDYKVPVEEWPGKINGTKFNSRTMTRVDEKLSFFMMAQTTTLIIADSTYSFWAARLNPHHPKVYVPKLTNRFAADYEYLNVDGWKHIETTAGLQTNQAVKKALNLKHDESALAEIRNSEWGA